MLDDSPRCPTEIPMMLCARSHLGSSIDGIHRLLFISGCVCCSGTPHVGATKAQQHVDLRRGGTVLTGIPAFGISEPAFSVSQGRLRVEHIHSQIA
jgi:hypothetical protein